MGLSRQEYWSVLLFPPPEDLPDLGIEAESPALAGGFLPLRHLRSPLSYVKKKFGHYLEKDT